MVTNKSTIEYLHSWWLSSGRQLPERKQYDLSLLSRDMKLLIGDSWFSRSREPAGKYQLKIRVVKSVYRCRQNSVRSDAILAQESYTKMSGIYYSSVLIFVRDDAWNMLNSAFKQLHLHIVYDVNKRKKVHNSSILEEDMKLKRSTVSPLGVLVHFFPF